MASSQQQQQTTARRTGGGFLLVTGGVATVGWMVAVGGLAALQSDAGALTVPASAGSAALGLGWWNMWLDALLLCAVVGGAMLQDRSSGQPMLVPYRSAVAMLLVLSCSHMAVDAQLMRTLIAAPIAGPRTSRAQAYLAGLILQMAVYLVWIVALASDSHTRIASLLLPSAAAIRPQPAPITTTNASVYQPMSAQPPPPQQQQQQRQYQPPQQQQQPSTSANSQPSAFQSNPSTRSPPQQQQQQQPRPSAQGSSNRETLALSVAESITYRAKALYSYTANVEDPNELSFQKNDVFEVLDNKGKWWQVRNTRTDQVGIAPSNYLQLLQG